MLSFGWLMPRLCLSAVAVLAAFSPSQHAAEVKPAGHVRTAVTGHVSNYEEAKVPPYTLPDPLVMKDGTPVSTADQWFQQRRPEILRAYEREIFGRVPATAPKARARVVSAGEVVENGTAVRKHVVVGFGPDDHGPKADVVIYAPAGAKRPVPVLLHVVFMRGLPSGLPEPAPADPKAAERWRNFRETGPVADLLARGYAYATFKYTDVQPDVKDGHGAGVQALAYAEGQSKPSADEWGTIAAWAWAASRVLDYLETDRDFDARRVAIIGHSRLGKTALWAGATDPRFALVFSSCSGEMGAALARRDFGETVDDMAERFPWQFAGNFQKYLGRWSEMPVDAHLLIALSAPRPVFVTGGTDDQWADPKGEFLALVAADPVYRLLGAPGLGTTELPPLDEPLIAGRLGWLYHTGGHSILPGDWKAFLDFADRHLRQGR